MNWDSEKKTKAERREDRKRNRRKMVVVGRGAKLLWQLIVKRASRKSKKQ